MRPHKILSAFKLGAATISPPGMWTPPDESVAARLIAAKCLRALGTETRPARAHRVEIPTVADLVASGDTEADAHAFVAHQEALAAGKSHDDADDAAEKARATFLAEKQAEVDAVAKTDAESDPPPKKGRGGRRSK
jgi:hypothetical protein